MFYQSPEKSENGLHSLKPIREVLPEKISTIANKRSNMAGNLLPWDGDDWEMSSEISEEEYEV